MKTLARVERQPAGKASPQRQLRLRGCSDIEPGFAMPPGSKIWRARPARFALPCVRIQLMTGRSAALRPATDLRRPPRPANTVVWSSPPSAAGQIDESSILNPGPASTDVGRAGRITIPMARNVAPVNLWPLAARAHRAGKAQDDHPFRPIRWRAKYRVWAAFFGAGEAPDRRGGRPAARRPTSFFPSHPWPPRPYEHAGGRAMAQSWRAAAPRSQAIGPRHAQGTPPILLLGTMRTLSPPPALETPSPNRPRFSSRLKGCLMQGRKPGWSSPTGLPRPSSDARSGSTSRKSVPSVRRDRQP